MKRIVYSSVTKFIAVILFVVSVVFGALAVSDGIIEFYNEDESIYNFENDFSQSWYISYLLREPENVVYNAYHNSFIGYDDSDNPFYRKEDPIKNLQQRFDDFYHSDKIDYFVQCNDAVFTNCDAETAEELMQGEYYSYVSRDSMGNIERDSSRPTDSSYMIEDLERFEETSTIIIACRIKPEVVDTYKAAWEKQEQIVFEAMKNTSVCAVSALLLLIFLLCVCGKNKDGEFKNIWIDNIWAEIHLAVMAGLGVGGVALSVIVLDEYMNGHFPQSLLDPVIAGIAALGSLGIITALLSVIRSIKTRRLLETSIICIVIRWAFRIVKWCIGILWKFIKWNFRQTKAFWSCIFRLLSRKSGILLSVTLLGYTSVIGICGIGTAYAYGSGQLLWFIGGILVFIFACFVLAHRAKDFDEIKKGVSNVRNGNISYKIPELKCEDMKALASNINDIAKGLDESVNAKLKAERMKTELITNVSHDLKTPITSIINYTELLSKIEDLPEEARDYASVIAKKSERLKNLTQDLFDISKVQSGNEQIVFEKLDTALLISQSLGEYDNEIGQSGLTFCVDTPKELCISADGRKMSRVVGNLISNILKYAMKNTRVFITAVDKDENIVMEFKNISAYPLDFDVDEIVQRFVRGDESRTSDGNGLGLAIAKSYTEICGGQFEITTDGDLFKVRLTFRKYS